MRNKKPVFILITLFFASFVAIALLAFLSKNTHKKNGFNRNLLTSTLKTSKQATFPMAISRVIGMRSGKLYFQGNGPYEIYRTDLSLDSLEIIKLPILPDNKLQSGIRMFLDGPHLYISCRNLPGIIEYNLDSGSIYSHIHNQYYSKEINVSNDRFILRTINPHSNDPIFVKINLKSNYTRWEDTFSEKKGEGNFPTDGILYYDSSTHLACYTYFYQNGFICMDTNLNLKLKARSIDTITKREIQVAHVGASFTMKQPPQFVNYTGDVSAGKLYLQSMLQADNEYELDFSENVVIDVYNLTNGAYKGSFYLPAYKGHKPYQFHVFDNKLYAIYPKTVILYDLNFIGDL